jgi:cyclopropane fatty-acyl-phospholipid synthase-like methyltransferase
MNPSIYTDGEYLKATGGTWHLEDSPTKARYIRDMLDRNPQLRPKTVCEIGCGAGGILSELKKLMPEDVTFTGYEISPQAHQMSQQFAGGRCRFVLGDAFADRDVFDLVAVMDVIEHVEDCFAFLRQTKAKGRYKIYNIPLDTSASFTLRGFNQWDSVGHLHLFTMETALKTIEHSGQKVLDWKLAPGAFERHGKSLKTHAMNAARAGVGSFSVKMAARLFGGYSLLVVAE